MKFRYYVIRKIILFFFVVFGVISFVFISLRSLPRDPVRTMLTREQMTDKELVAHIRATWNLDKPLYIQYLTYMRNVLRGNLGRSMYTETLVTKDLQRYFPCTLELTIAGFLIAILIGVPIGIYAAVHSGSISDHFARIFSIIGVCAPSFWFGIMFLLIFYMNLGWVGSGRIGLQYSVPQRVTGLYMIDSLLEGDPHKFLDVLKHLILPAITLGLGGNAMLMRITRSSMLEVLNKDYLKTARMKGLSERVVIYRHALKNALIPTTTYAGMLLGIQLGGAVLTETVFNLRGLGGYAVNTALHNDVWGLGGACLLMAIIFTTCNLIVDIIYGYLDPRVRIG